jgi:ribosomal protein L12E/L44/L45/RPP1/RPP2
MPWVKISKDAHRDMKEFLVDIEGISLGELVELAFEYAMENVADFEAFLELPEEGEEEGQDETKEAEEQETDKEEEQSDEE